MCVRVRACMRVCLRACVRTFVHARVLCVHSCDLIVGVFPFCVSVQLTCRLCQIPMVLTPFVHIATNRSQ